MGGRRSKDTETLDCQCWLVGHFLCIPDYDEDEPEEEYPGGIPPGIYTRNQVVSLMRKHAENPEAIRFLADMLEV